jgi:phosphoenolpyruvate synthase/pyruvate phosphate dikinase
VAAELSAAVAAVAVPDEVGSAVVAACAELGPARVAVRSSATAEDLVRRYAPVTARRARPRGR